MVASALDRIGKLRPRWYVVMTQPGREFWAEENLMRQGFEVFLPFQIRSVRHARKSLRRRVAFFPRYCFVRLDLARDRWRSVNGTSGVVRMVMAGDEPVPVPDPLVHAMQQQTNNEGEFRPHQEFMHGDRVRLLDAPFKDVLATIDRLDGNHRVRVLLQIMSSPKHLIVDKTKLLRVTSGYAPD